MDQDRVGPGRGRALEELQAGRDAGDDLAHLGAALDLEPVGAVVAPAVGVEELVGVGDELGQRNGSSRCGTLVHGRSVAHSGQKANRPRPEGGGRSG